MVVLAPRFAVLATFAAIAAFSELPEADGAAIQAREPADGYNSYRTFGHSRRFSHPSTRTIPRRQATAAPEPSPARSPADSSTNPPPTLPLPVIGQEKFKSEGAGGAEAKSKPSRQINKVCSAYRDHEKSPILMISCPALGSVRPITSSWQNLDRRQTSPLQTTQCESRNFGISCAREGAGARVQRFL